MTHGNQSSFAYLKGILVFSFFLLRGISIDELLGRSAEFSEFSIGTYILAGGLVLFSVLTLMKDDARLPFHFFYLFGVVFLITLSFLFWSNLNAGTASLGLYMEYVFSLSLVLFIFFTFRTNQEIDAFFTALIYSSLIISIFWIFTAIRESGELWRVGNIAGSGANYPTVSYQLAAAAWAGPMVNLLSRSRKFSYKLFRDIPLLLTFTYGIMLTGTRGGLLVELLLIGTLFFFHFKEISKQNAMRFYLEIVIFVILPLATLGYFLSQLAEQFAVISRVLDVFNPEGIGGRSKLWAFALSQSFSNLENLLIGGGFGGFELFQTEAETARYPHNFFLDLGFNAGFPAAILLSFWILHMWKNVFQYLKKKGQDVFLKERMLKILGWGIVACYAGLTVFKFSSNIMLWFFIALAMRMRQNSFMELKEPIERR